MSTEKLVFDSWAWIEYFRGSKSGMIVKRKSEKREIFTNAVTISEVISKFVRENLDADSAFEGVTSLSKVIVVSGQSAKKVGLLHATIKKSSPNFSLADAYALQTARDLHAKVLTGDPDFKGVRDAELLK